MHENKTPRTAGLPALAQTCRVQSTQWPAGESACYCFDCYCLLIDFYNFCNHKIKNGYQLLQWWENKLLNLIMSDEESDFE